MSHVVLNMDTEWQQSAVAALGRGGSDALERSGRRAEEVLSVESHIFPLFYVVVAMDEELTVVHRNTHFSTLTPQLPTKCSVVLLV